MTIAAVAVGVAAVIASMWFGWLPAPWRGHRGSLRNADAALRQAAQLQSAGRFTESAPLLLAALEEVQENRVSLRRAYAALLVYGATEVRSRNGVRVYGARSTAQRIEMAHESLRQVQIALSETTDPKARALLLDDAGRTEEWWGLTWDALQKFDAAAQLDPQSAEIRQHAQRCAATILLGVAPAR